MITNLTHSFIYVLDLDRAIAFYIQKLGMKIRADLTVNAERWATLYLHAQKDLEILLVVVEDGLIFKTNQAKKMKSLILEQTLSYACLSVKTFGHFMRRKEVRV